MGEIFKLLTITKECIRRSTVIYYDARNYDIGDFPVSVMFVLPKQQITSCLRNLSVQKLWKTSSALFG